MAGHQHAPDARMVVVLLQHLDIGVRHALFGVKGPRALTARPGHDISYLLEERMRLVIGIGELTQPLGAGAVEDDLDLVTCVFELLCDHHGVDRCDGDSERGH